MKKPIIPGLVILLFVVFIALLFAETLIVKVQSTSLRKSPKFYAPGVMTLKAGEKLEKLSSQDGWLEVRSSNGTVGWIHSSAIDVQKFKLMATDERLKTQAAAGEVALAGKGFNKQVEESFRARHGEANYVWVDKMLLIKIPISEIEAFMRSGRLGEFRGGQ